MKKTSSMIGILLTGSLGHSTVHQSELKDLNKLGIESGVVTEAFKQIHNLALQSSEKLMITSDDEGQNLKFDTLDNYSVIVPIELASAPNNKDFFGR